MDEVGGALIGIALVLVAVFVPTAFISPASRAVLQAVRPDDRHGDVISLIVSLTLSPALAA